MGTLSSDFFQYGTNIIVSTVITVPFVMLFFFLLSYPLRIRIKYAKDYRTAMKARRWIDTILLVIIFIGLYSQLFDDVNLFDRSLSFSDRLKPLLFAVVAAVPMYYFMHYLMGRRYIYTEEQAHGLEYFILFLRSFKNDEIGSKAEKRLMESLSKLFHPYAIGRPNDIMPPQGARRIYVGEEWRDLVKELQAKAPIILQRINISDNFLWEFDQCVQHGYLNKVIFWVVDYKEYEEFKALVRERYHLHFPNLFHADDKLEMLFYYKSDGSFEIYPLKDKAAYEGFAAIYTAQHGKMQLIDGDYQKGRDIASHKQLFKLKYDEQVASGIDGLDWVAGLFPVFFVATQSLKDWFGYYVLYAFLFFSSISISPLIWCVALYFMYLMYRNGRRMAWLGTQWESRQAFEDSYKSNRTIAMYLGIIEVLFTVLFIFSSIFGW